MTTELIVSCPVKIFKRCLRGHLSQIGIHSQLTVNYVIDGHTPLLVVCDEQRQELLRLVPETDITRYTILCPYRHEISRYNDLTIILNFHKQARGDVRTFRDAMEEVFRGLNRFSSQGEVRDSSSSGSDGDSDQGGAAGAAALQPTPTVVYWECAQCHFASPDPHSWRCEECSEPRVVNEDLEWQCICHRVYPIGIAECKSCGIWRCDSCTCYNEPTSPHQCCACGTERIR